MSTFRPPVATKKVTPTETRAEPAGRRVDFDEDALDEFAVSSSEEEDAREDASEEKKDAEPTGVTSPVRSEKDEEKLDAVEKLPEITTTGSGKDEERTEEPPREDKKRAPTMEMRAPAALSTKRPRLATEGKRASDDIVFKVPKSRVVSRPPVVRERSAEELPRLIETPTRMMDAPTRMMDAPTPTFDEMTEREIEEALAATDVGERDEPVDDALEFEIAVEDFPAPASDAANASDEDQEDPIVLEHRATSANVARALVKADELLAESEDAVFDSTQLLLNSYRSANDYYFLFNPKLKRELRALKDKANSLLARVGESS